MVLDLYLLEFGWFLRHCMLPFRPKQRVRELKNIGLFGVLKARIHFMISCKARNSLTM